MDYTQHFSTKATPQTQAIPGEKQIKNAAGGYVYEIDSWARLRRFLILGTEGGTYYAKEKEFTKENAENVLVCIKADANKVVEEIVRVSDGGLAPKNDAAIFALALVCTFGEEKHRGAAYKAIPRVCRTGTHLFTFCQAIQNLRGWSRGLRNGVAQYYKAEPGRLAYQLVKYRQRNGWTHRDVLRLCHPTPPTATHNQLYRYALGKGESSVCGQTIEDYEFVSKQTKVTPEVIDRVTRLPWEAIPTEFLKDKKVWEALLPNMPLMALMRNLNKLSAYAGVDSNLSDNAKVVADRFTKEAIIKARLHPLKILEAMKTYGQGHGMKGSLKWTPAPIIQDALNAAFYHGFHAVEPTGKAFLIGLDVSGSMSSQMPGSVLSCAEAAAALCMVIARTEQKYMIVGFCDKLVQLDIRPSMSLPDVMQHVQHRNFGRTDCAVPMLVALDKGLGVDVFQVITDNETWHGQIHPMQALRQYRKSSGLKSKLVVWGMTATVCSIADPKDPGTLDVVGFDTSVPDLIRSFIV